MMYRAPTILFLLTFLASISGIVVADSSTASLIPNEADVIKELNAARTNPRAYARYLEDMRQYFNGKRFKRPGEITLVTKEGVSAVDEAIAFLRSASPVKPLSLSRGMSKAAADHAKDQSRSGKTGHDGREGSQPWDRVNRYGTWSGKIGENVGYGDQTAREAVISLIVDDGVTSRGHRANIFNPDYHVVGIACGTHPKWRTVCVSDFAQTYQE
jgi:uncharacterized protein YkwD